MSSSLDLLAHNCCPAPMLAVRRSSRLPLLPHAGYARVRCVLGDVVPRLAVSSTLGSLVGSGNVIASAAAAARAGSVSGGAVHGAVTSALAHVAVTAVAIASGAALSTKVDFLWPRVDDLPDTIEIEGVDVTGYPIFQDAEVQKAIAFAGKAHLGQFRKTGEPYITHCIHTGKILAALVPSSGKRAVSTIVAAILHDVIDDTVENLRSIETEFGDDVARMVAGVSKLSYINQILRRHRRGNVDGSDLSPDDADSLRVMLLGMVDDPRVVLIKLADRLHNMRTIYALSMPKAQAVAQETLSVWCSLASRLGVWALKAELEDLCFAVLQPDIFRGLRAELAFMWNASNKARNVRRSYAKSVLLHPSQDCGTHRSGKPKDDEVNMKNLLDAVLPFDLFLDRKKRSLFLRCRTRGSEVSVGKPKIVNDAFSALASLETCEAALEQELLISTSYVPGMEVTLSSRLKSLYSIYCKMRRKDISIREVYDARALRVIVGDKDGSLHGPAVRTCYSILDTVQRLWTPVDGEFDDYIVNPKPSGYQSLHTAVQGPDGSPLEVQIRTQLMHEHAEFGLAAHWLYKENNIETKSTLFDKTDQSNSLEDESYLDEVPCKYSSIKAGHPVLRIEGSHLLVAVIVRVDKGGKELLVAVSFDTEASEVLSWRRTSSRSTCWEAYAKLYKKVSDKWWFSPGHGDWSTCLEKYTLCQDGIFHKQDQFERLLPTFIQIINLTEEEDSEYWMVMSAVFEGKDCLPVSSRSSFSGKSGHNSNLATDPISNKVRLLRTMLRWEEEMSSGTSSARRHGKNSNSDLEDASLDEVLIICSPQGKIMRMRSGSTAADAATRMGMEGKLILVNGELVLPLTELRDGDVVEVRI